MIDFFVLTLSACMLCLGVHAVTRQGSVLGFWHNMVKDENGDLRFALAKPMSECLTCMSSIYGTIMYGMCFGFPGSIPAVFFMLIAMIFISILGELCAISESQVEFSQILQKGFYLAFIFVFCVSMYREKTPEAFAFILCLCGCNYFVDHLLAAINSDIERNDNEMKNAMDEAQAIDEICDSIRALKKP